MVSPTKLPRPRGPCWGCLLVQKIHRRAILKYRIANSSEASTAATAQDGSDIIQINFKLSCDYRSGQGGMQVFCKVMGEWSACLPLSRSLGAGGYSSCFPPHPPSSPHTSAHLRVHASCASSFSFALHILHNCTHKCCTLETRFCLKTWSAEFTLSALSTSLALVFCNNPINTKQFPSFKRWQIISRNSCRRWSFPPPPASPRWALLGVGHHWPAPACK